MAEHNPINWFEIPVRDMSRAVAFYETLLATSLKREAIAGSELAVFDYGDAATGGCLMGGPHAPAPSLAGTLVYLNAGVALDPVVARVEAAGGRVVTPKVQLPGAMGCYAHIADTEGNRIGLHAPR